MFTITVNHTNPSRDNEYTKVEQCNGFILLAFREDSVSVLADGMRLDNDSIRSILMEKFDEQPV